MTLAPCLSCGEPVAGSRCRECQAAQEKTYSRRPKTAASTRGYDWRWTQLSRRARRTQPWCSDCGREDTLTTDHTPQAWAAYLDGRPITLAMVDVVCNDCNNERGTARPGGKRWREAFPTRAGQAKFGSLTRQDRQILPGRRAEDVPRRGPVAPARAPSYDSAGTHREPVESVEVGRDVVVALETPADRDSVFAQVEYLEVGEIHGRSLP